MDGTRRYLHPFLDSARWNRYRPRSGDIIIATPFKSGTTWMQMIVLGLLHGIETPPLLKDVDHWIDSRFADEIEMVNRLEGQSSRRFIKSHLPFDAMPFHQNVKYLVVDRDPRDVFMSLWNHYRNMDVNMLNKYLPPEIEPIPFCPEDVHEFWETWLTRGYFSWEAEGYPFWSNLRHAQSWFDVKHLDNVLHVHYDNLLSNSASEISKIANFIDVDISNDQANSLADYTSFKNTKSNLEKLFPGGYRLFENGADTFFYKGVNGRWRDVLTSKDDDLFQSVSRSILSRGCYKWLLKGEL